VAGSGSGLYEQISGSFDVVVTIDEVEVKPVCNGTSQLHSQTIVISGSGIASLG
jgi:hypothetical protein